MFGLTEQEMDLYRDLAQDFAVTTVAPQIVKGAQFMTPVALKDDKQVPDMVFLRQLLTDIETIVTLTAAHVAYDYAHLQCELEMTESEIIQHLHKKYETYVVSQFLKYGITFTEDTIPEIVGEIILELPYMYVSVIQDDEFDEDGFLEERLAAYNEYLNENFAEPDEDEEEFEEED